MRVYISGPISGVDNQNRYSFKQAVAELKSMGHSRVNPIVIGDKLKKRLFREPTWVEYMRADIIALLGCDAIYMLKGWHKSEGAKLEHSMAERLGLSRMYQGGINTPEVSK